MLTYERVVALLLIALIAATTVALQALKVIDVLASMTEIWIWVAAILLGIAVSLLTRGITVGTKGQIVEPVKSPPERIPRYVESGTPIIPKNGEPIILTSQLLAGMDFYPSRKELQTEAPIEDLVKSARSSVDLLGFTIESWSVGLRDTIRKSLKDGKRFRFIVLSPAFTLMKQADGLDQRMNLQGRISGSLRMLQTIKSELSVPERDRLDIRFHDLLPIHSIVAIDAESESGVIYVEYYVYGTDSRSWVTLRISKKEQSRLFDRYWQSYKHVWERSKVWA